MIYVKKGLMAAGIFASCAAVLCACGKETEDAGEEKQTVSIALWADQLLENYAPWIQEQFPDVEFDFYSATNSTDYYRWLSENDALPDILTVRRFSLKDVENLKDDLMDLSDSELAISYYQSYLRSYTYSDGTVNWLPACAEIDDIIINKTLFDENNIEIPTDYESFVAACEAFEEIGITGFVTDMGADYTCMETLQGFSAQLLSTAEGRQWRQDYESGKTNQLSEEVWLSAFEKLMDVIEVNGMDEDTLLLKGGTVGEAFANGEVAMFRGSVSDLEKYGADYECMIIPYPGESEDESFYLTYPVFQAAAKETDSEERSELIMEILTAMLSEEGLNHIIPGESMVAYKKDVSMQLDESIENLEPYIEENRMYIRLASADMFSVSQTVVGQIITGEITTAQDAFDTFNSILKENESDNVQETVAHIDTGYSRLFTKEHGNQAASALYNTMREELGADILIGQSAVVCGDVLEGDYTQKELGYLLNWEGSDAMQMELTGSRLYEYLEFYLNVKQTRDSVANDYTLPVSSGMEMMLSKTDDGYHVEKLTINGEEIDSEKTYTVVVWSCFTQSATEELEESGFTDYVILEDGLESLINKRLVEEGGQLSSPTDYITLQ